MNDLLSQLEQLRKEATPEPWYAWTDIPSVVANNSVGRTIRVATTGGDGVASYHEEGGGNAAYIAALVNAAPALLACVRAADAMRTHYRQIYGDQTLAQERTFDAALQPEIKE